MLPKSWGFSGLSTRELQGCPRGCLPLANRRTGRELVLWTWQEGWVCCRTICSRWGAQGTDWDLHVHRSRRQFQFGSLWHPSVAKGDKSCQCSVSLGTLLSPVGAVAPLLAPCVHASHRLRLCDDSVTVTLLPVLGEEWVTLTDKQR